MRRIYNTEKPKLGDTKVVRKFLWLPLRIGDEERWLEYAHIVYVYKEVFKPLKIFVTIKEQVWSPLAWKNL